MLKRTVPPAGESVVGGIAMPLLDERVVEALNAEVEAAYQFHSHEWWFRSQDRIEAERVIAEAAGRLGGEL